MSSLSALKAATSLRDVANLLGFKPQALSYILYKQPNNEKYTIFQIPKRNGGHRTIKAPVQGLKLVQRRLCDLLQNCLDEINDSKNRADLTAHGFMRKRSIITNARRHRRKRYVFNVDLEDFFPSINFGRVRGFFEKDRNFSLAPSVATLVAQIACHDNSLPQGSPCSPVISNLIAHILDMRLVRLAWSKGCVYSRYADDLTFSTSKDEFPPGIGTPIVEDGESRLWAPGDALRAEIKRSGFRINPSKTHLMFRHSRQQVTGLIVNERVGVRAEYRHNVRAMVHSLLQTGRFEMHGVTHKSGATVLEKRSGALEELHGMLGFIDSIDVYNKINAAPHHAFEPHSRVLLYRRFLMYAHLYACASPVIICEGETDNIYLTHAIRHFAGTLPDLAEVAEDKKILIKVRIYKYPHSSTARILELKDGGSAGLSSFITSYKKEVVRFRAPSLGNPVVILYDNDDGAVKVRNTIREIIKKPVAPAEPFVHVISNMYAVPTPLLGGATQSKIEDFFDEDTKGTVINGKAFTDQNKFDKDKYYGKSMFAHNVVELKAGAIDFSGFRPLLLNLVAAINAHKAKYAGSL